MPTGYASSIAQTIRGPSKSSTTASYCNARNMGTDGGKNDLMSNPLAGNKEVSHKSSYRCFRESDSIQKNYHAQENPYLCNARLHDHTHTRGPYK